MSVFWRRISSLCIAILVSAPNRGAAFQSPPPIAERAHQILIDSCAPCHKEGGDKSAALKLKVQRYDDVKASAAEILEQVDGRYMPKGSALKDADRITLMEWVSQGAPNWETPSLTARTFVSEARILQTIQADIKKQSELVRPYLRYYSLVHLYNAQVSDADLQQYRVGLSKLVNSLSRAPEIAVPVSINPERTLFRIDLHQFKWDDAIWKTIVRAYPYGYRSSGSDEIRQLTGADVPYVRADWFVFQASTPPLYHEILRLPSTVKELESVKR
jgi:hypothetical protein